MGRGISLYPHQKKALSEMKNGCILCGGVGSGKSRTSLAYYYILNGGQVDSPEYVKMKHPTDLYIITTAMKRDSLEWEKELIPFRLNPYEEGLYKNKVTIDSWNNINKYIEVQGAFFIFDEQKVVGYGAWTKAFLKIVKQNSWILLSATPGDTWMDYIPVFIANGFYRNKTDFVEQHVIWSRYTKYPHVDRYFNERKLEYLRNLILVDMPFERDAVQIHEDIPVEYDRIGYRDILMNRWDPWENRPFQNAGELCYALRKVVNSDISRVVALLELLEDHDRVIVFYNFDYELELLRGAEYGSDVAIAEWNGHEHQPIPDSNRWVYFVQYTAGAEGWNCIKTDTMIFFSQSYSYRATVQACGRIDRMNTPYKELHYYHFKSKAPIDLAIGQALRRKKNFNIRKFVGEDYGKCNNSRNAQTSIRCMVPQRNLETKSENDERQPSNCSIS